MFMVRTARLVTRSNRISGSYTNFIRAISVAKDTNSLLVNWDQLKGVWSRFHYQWLRDNCACPKCCYPDTGQRILRMQEDARPNSVITDNERVEISWKDGHNSQYKHSWLLENSYYHNNIANIKPSDTTTQRSDIVLWDAGYFKSRQPPSVEYEEYMNSDEGLLKMLRQFRRYGLCFIHNTPASEEATFDVVRRVGPLRRTYYGDVWSMVAGNMSVGDIAYWSGLVDLHTDNIFLTEAPGLLAFHCIECEFTGGESLFIDGFCVADHIHQTQPDHFQLLSKVSLPFQMQFKDALYQTRKRFFQPNHEGQIIETNYNYIDRQPIDNRAMSDMQAVLDCDPDKAISTFYKAMDYLHSLLYGSQFAYEIKLLPGACLLFDNHRLLHGRKPLTGHRKLCGSSVNREEWESKLKTLERQAQNNSG